MAMSLVYCVDLNIGLNILYSNLVDREVIWLSANA
jgi:hypothetical protein